MNKKWKYVIYEDKYRRVLLKALIKCGCPIQNMLIFYTMNIMTEIPLFKYNYIKKITVPKEKSYREKLIDITYHILWYLFYL